MDKGVGVRPRALRSVDKLLHGDIMGGREVEGGRG